MCGITGIFDIPSRMTFSPSGARLAVSGKAPGDPLVLVDPDTGRELQRIAVPWKLRPSGLLWIDDRTLVAGGFGGGIVYRLDDAGRWNVLREVGGNWINPRRIGEDSALTVSMSGEVLERSIATGEVKRFYRGLSDMAAMSSLSPDGSLLAAVGTDRRLHVFDTATGDQLLSLLGHAPGRIVNSVEFSRDGERVYSLDSGGGLVIWDAGPTAAVNPAAR